MVFDSALTVRSARGCLPGLRFDPPADSFYRVSAIKNVFNRGQRRNSAKGAQR
jgi:hypothetical protein